MRIAPRFSDRKNRVAQEVRRAHSLGPLPDPVCCANCADYRPTKSCHRYCAAAPRRLSSEGERSPVEPLVAPLVFELKKLGVFHPCWSCEGHADQEGRLRKIPRVWFYADSVVHLRGLSEAIDRLFNRQRLSTHWQIVLTYSDAGNPDTTFSLEPQPEAPDCLGALQADLRVMADELADAFWGACDALAARPR